MAIRTLIFNVTADNKPIYKDPVWAGMQFEDNATEIVFSPDTELLQKVGESALFRIDFNSPAGYSPSNNLSADENGNYKRTLPYSMTFIGGEIEAVFVITSADGNLELLSLPVTLYLTDIKRDAVCEDTIHKGLSATEESVRLLSLSAVTAAEKAESCAKDAQLSKNQTEEARRILEEDTEFVFDGGNAVASVTAVFKSLDCYPIGSLYLSTEFVAPTDIFGGKWLECQSPFLLSGESVYCWKRVS